MEPFSFLTFFVQKLRTTKPVRGFSLVELVVVIGIIIVITAVTFVGQTTFNRSLLITDTAYTVALSTRETQSLGLSSKKFVTGGVTTQNAGYGVHFSMATPTSYVQYADVANTNLLQTATWCKVGTVGMPDYKPGDCMWNSAAETVRTYTFSQGFHIVALCGTPVGGSYTCVTGTNARLDVEYLRPNTQAVISGSGDGSTYYQASQACVAIAAPTGETRYVEFTQLGQVSVTTTCP